MKQPISFYRSRGFSLIEFMIAGTLGLVLLAGVGQLFVGSNGAFRANRVLAGIQDNGRFALWYLAGELRNSGWDTTDSAESFNFDFDSDCAGPCSTFNDANGNDSFTVRYLGTTDCSGATVANNEVINRYYIQNNTLMCDGNASSPQPIADNIESLHVLYGVDIDNSALDFHSVDKYINTSEVLNLKSGYFAMNNIRSVRIALLVAGSEATLQDRTTRSYQLLDRSVTRTDLTPRRVYSVTLKLGNVHDSKN